MMKHFFSILLVLVIPFLTGTVSFAAQAEWDYHMEDVTPPFGTIYYGIPGEVDNLFCLTNFNKNTGEIELWGHDGVNPFTLIFTIPANPGGGGISSHTEFNGKLLFAGANGLGGYDLWEWDRTNPPTMVTTMNFSWVYSLTVYNGKVYFHGEDEIHGGELWEYDGINQPQLVEDIYPGATGSAPHYFVVFNGKLLFSAWERWQGRELFQFDGSSVSLAAEFKPGSAGSSPQTFVEFNGKLYLIAYDYDGRHIWEYDGENPPTRVTQQDCSPGELTVFGNRILFKGYDTTHREELWAYDGVNPPALLYDIYTPPNYGSYPRYFTVVGDHLYFSAYEILTGRELWVYDGKKPPRLLKDFCPGSQYSKPQLYEAGGRLYIRGEYCLKYKLLMFDNVLIPQVETLAVSEVTASSAVGCDLPYLPYTGAGNPGLRYC
jgi:ELWxxDGT repeat protein